MVISKVGEGSHLQKEIHPILEQYLKKINRVTPGENRVTPGDASLHRIGKEIFIQAET